NLIVGFGHGTDGPAVGQSQLQLLAAQLGRDADQARILHGFEHLAPIDVDEAVAAIAYRPLRVEPRLRSPDVARSLDRSAPDRDDVAVRARPRDHVCLRPVTA